MWKVKSIFLCEVSQEVFTHKSDGKLMYVFNVHPMKIKWKYDKYDKSFSRHFSKSIRLFTNKYIYKKKQKIHMTASKSIEIHAMNVVFYAFYVGMKSILIYGLRSTFICFQLRIKCVLFSYFILRSICGFRSGIHLLNVSHWIGSQYVLGQFNSISVRSMLVLWLFLAFFLLSYYCFSFDGLKLYFNSKHLGLLKCFNPLEKVFDFKDTNNNRWFKIEYMYFDFDDENCFSRMHWKRFRDSQLENCVFEI